MHFVKGVLAMMGCLFVSSAARAGVVTDLLAGGGIPAPMKPGTTTLRTDVNVVAKVLVDDDLSIDCTALDQVVVTPADASRTVKIYVPDSAPMWKSREWLVRSASIKAGWEGSRLQFMQQIINNPFEEGRIPRTKQERKERDRFIKEMERSIKDAPKDIMILDDRDTKFPGRAPTLRVSIDANAGQSSSGGVVGNRVSHPNIWDGVGITFITRECPIPASDSVGRMKWILEQTILRNSPNTVVVNGWDSQLEYLERLYPSIPVGDTFTEETDDDRPYAKGLFPSAGNEPNVVKEDRQEEIQKITKLSWRLSSAEKAMYFIVKQDSDQVNLQYEITYFSRSGAELKTIKETFTGKPGEYLRIGLSSQFSGRLTDLNVEGGKVLVEFDQDHLPKGELSEQERASLR